MKKARQEDHERSRRELAISLLAELWKNLDHKHSMARKLVESIDDDATRSLAAEKEFRLDPKFKGQLKTCIDYGKSEKERESSEFIYVSKEESQSLRWLIVTYLNQLESVCSAWKHNVADRGIIAEQFRYLVSDRDNHFILERFRVVSGREHYPAIDAFSKALKEAKPGELIAPKDELGGE